MHKSCCNWFFEISTTCSKYLKYVPRIEDFRAPSSGLGVSLNLSDANRYTYLNISDFLVINSVKHVPTYNFDDHRVLRQDIDK